MHALAEIHITSFPRPRLQHVRFLREVVDLVILIGAIYVLVNLTTVRFNVQGSSMVPSFEEDQFLIVSRMNYLLGQPDRGDVVVFHNPDDPTEDFIKRVIGLPGEMVEIRGTQVFVNGKPLDEPYIKEQCSPSSCNDRTWQLGADEYFVMGDNRNRSKDSRSFGPVLYNHLVGEVVVRYWPPSDWGMVDALDYPEE